jgi:hypothetical protein
MAVSKQEGETDSPRQVAHLRHDSAEVPSFGLATHCQRVTAPDAGGVSSEFSDCPVMLCSCQKAVAVIVSNDLPEQVALNTELRSLSVRTVL